MKKNVLFSLFISLFVSLMPSEAQTISKSVQNISTIGLGLTKLISPSSDGYRFSPLNVYLGRSYYVTKSMFIEGGVGLRSNIVEFKAEDLEYRRGILGSPLTLFDIRMVLPLSAGVSFTIEETQQQIDLMAGTHLSYGLYGSFTSKELLAPLGMRSNYNFGSAQRYAYDNDPDGTPLTRRFNVGLDASLRYWFKPAYFVTLSCNYDLLNQFNSKSIRAINSNQDKPLEANNLNVTLALGISF